MKLIKALNNNVALVCDDQGTECIVTGKGIAYDSRPDAVINASKIEKKYVLERGKKRINLDDLMKNISPYEIELASEIIRRGEIRLGYKFSGSSLLALADHLALVLERAKEGMYFETPLEWDIKCIYPKEYRYCLEAVDYLGKKTGCKIPTQEAAFITLHFINGSSENQDMHNTKFQTKVIQNILSICKLYNRYRFSEDDFNTGRFIAHVRYFVSRQILGQTLDIDLDIAGMIAQKCPEDYKCAKKIALFLEETYGWQVSEGEVLYLTLHLDRIKIVKE